MKSLIIIPTYNEKDNIAAIIDVTLKQDEQIEILIVDDNSPDKTAQIVKSLMQDNHRIHLIEREGKLGLGSAYLQGFAWALERDYQNIFEMDADFSHNPARLPEMIEILTDHDAVIGSRYIGGTVNVIHWTMKRLLLSYLASRYVKLITGMTIDDPTSGFVGYRREILQQIMDKKIYSDGYSFQIEMKYRIWVRKGKMKEIPIVFTERKSGISKMSKKIVYEAIYMVWKLRFMQIVKKL
jgi:dolichol-phosphate mannosyltransferase